VENTDDTAIKTNGKYLQTLSDVLQQFWQWCDKTNHLQIQTKWP